MIFYIAHHIHIGSSKATATKGGYQHQSLFCLKLDLCSICASAIVVDLGRWPNSWWVFLVRAAIVVDLGWRLTAARPSGAWRNCLWNWLTSVGARQLRNRLGHDVTVCGTFPRVRWVLDCATCSKPTNKIFFTFTWKSFLHRPSKGCKYNGCRV